MSKNIAIIGAGIIGTRLAGIFDKFEDLKISRICDINKTSADKLAEKFGGRVTHDYNQVLQDPLVDIVYVGVPPQYHKEIVIAALDANKHVISEKPLALSVVDCEEMVNTKNKHLPRTSEFTIRICQTCKRPKQFLRREEDRRCNQCRFEGKYINK